MPSVHPSFAIYSSWGQSRTFKRRDVSIVVTPHADGDTIDQLMFIAWEIEPNATWEDLDNFRKDLINTFVNQPRLKFINYPESFPMLIEVNKLYYYRTGRNVLRVAKVVDIAKNYVVLRAVSLDPNGFVCFESPICHVRSKAEFEHKYHVGNGVEKTTTEEEISTDESMQTKDDPMAPRVFSPVVYTYDPKNGDVSIRGYGFNESPGWYQNFKSGSAFSIEDVPPVEQRLAKEYSLPKAHVIPRYMQAGEALNLAYKWGGLDNLAAAVEAVRSVTPDKG